MVSIEVDNIKSVDYNEEPVFFCTKCLSLAVLDADGICYCNECGSTDVRTTDIFQWEEKYQKMYNKKYIDKNGRED
jgi:hypothetical protein